MKTSPKIVRSVAIALLALSVSFTATTLSAATGDELLAGSLPASSVNKSIVGGEVLTKAVYDAVSSNKGQAPEIVAAAIPKTNSIETQKSIVKAAVSALGDSRKSIPQVVYAAIKSAPNCGSSDGKSGYSKESSAGCECAEEFTRAAIEALGANPSEGLVSDIITAAIQATDGRCARQVARAGSEAAPQFASSIADAAARAGRGDGGFDGGDPGDSLVFSPTGRPVPAPFVIPPATNGGGLAAPTTPVN